MRTVILLALLTACANHGSKTPLDSDVPEPEDTEVDRVRDTGDTALDSGPDSDPVEVDTGDSAGGLWFRPNFVSYTAEFAVDEASTLRSFAIARTLYEPYFLITLSRGADTCEIVYALAPGAFAYEGQAGADADVLGFLATEDQRFGFVVRPGLYTATTSARCDDLPPGYATDLPAEMLALRSGGDPELFVGLDLTPDPAVVTALVQPGVTESQILGGRLRFPFAFTGIGGATTNFFEVGGVKAEVDAAYGLVISPTNTLVLREAAESWVDGRPGAGFYRMIATYGFTITP